MAGRRKNIKHDSSQSIRSAGERLAIESGIPVSRLRYVEYHYHTGKQWTVQTDWEYFDGLRWQVVDWTGFVDRRIEREPPQHNPTR